VRYFAALVAFEVALVSVTGSAAYQAYLAWNAGLARMLLDLLGFDASSEGADLYVGATGITVLRSCDAAEPCGMLVIAVLLLPGTWTAKLAAALAGVAALHALNAVRLASLVLALRSWPGAFTELHLVVWPLVMIAAVFGGLVAWGRVLAKARPAP
jgi:exosortase/archaeosortase family protein